MTIFICILATVLGLMNLFGIIAQIKVLEYISKLPPECRPKWHTSRETRRNHSTIWACMTLILTWNEGSGYVEGKERFLRSSMLRDKQVWNKDNLLKCVTLARMMTVSFNDVCRWFCNNARRNIVLLSPIMLNRCIKKWQTQYTDGNTGF